MTNKQTLPDQGNMTLIGHLVELRDRLINALVSILLVFLSLFYFANDIYEIVSRPIREVLPEGATMIATEVTSTFFAPFKLTMVLSLVIAIPMVLNQVWAFISPGLYSHERKLAVPLLATSVALFYSGIAFAYFVVFPLVMGFFMGIGPEHIQLAPDINHYLNIALKLFLAFGFAFEIPIATMILIWSGVSTIESLKQKRAYVIVGCFVFGMLLTPPDIISQTLLAVPMWILFELGLLLGHIVQRQKEAHEESQEESS